MPNFACCRRASGCRSVFRRRGGGQAMLTTHESAIPCDSDKAAAAHDESILYYDVVHTKVVVREARSTAARAVATKVLGDIVCADAEVDGWAKLIDQSGWMLVDGAHVGLGALLKRRMPPSLSASAQKAGASSQRALSIVGDDGSHIVLRDGTLMPLLGLGTGGVPGLEGDDCVRLVTYAIAQCGVRLIDTAADYHNEEAVGEAIRRCGVPRSELFVCTKIGPLSQGHAACSASVRRSLQRMGLDYLDCVFIHWPGAWVAEQKEWGPQDWLNGRGVALAREYRAASWRALEDMKADGSVRHLGISNYTPAHIVELLSSCRVPPDLLQSEHHPFFTNAHVRKACRAHGIAFMAYGPLSGGQAERRQGQKGVHNRVVLEVASSCGKTPSQVLLRWATQRGVAVLPKSHREAGIRENADARGFRLSDAAMARLESLETGQPTYWDPNCVDSLDHFNVFLDKERLQAALR